MKLPKIILAPVTLQVLGCQDDKLHYKIHKIMYTTVDCVLGKDTKTLAHRHFLLPRASLVGDDWVESALLRVI